jgi:hypothetical protein
MHNGGIAGWSQIRRKLQDSLPDHAYGIVQGNTDSEWCFATFISKVRIY